MSNPIFKFEEAQRLACKASIMIEGLTGRGKSGLALALAYILANKDWKKVFDIDTENKSANLFVGIPASTGNKFGHFQVGYLTPDIGYKPSNYLAFRDAAIQAGAEVVIKDSISHAWQYKSGVLDLVNAAAERDKKNSRADKYAAWRDPEVSSEKLNLLDLIRSPDVHVITTVRVKEKFEYQDTNKGKELVSLGEQQIQQDDLKYEPDLVLHMLSPGRVEDGKVYHPVAKVIKTRYTIFKLNEIYEFTPELMEQLRKYLAEGADPEELLEQQRIEYVQAVKDYLDSHPSAVPIWTVLKKDAGHDETKLPDLPLRILKELYTKITM